MKSSTKEVEFSIDYVHWIFKINLPVHDNPWTGWTKNILCYAWKLKKQKYVRSSKLHETFRSWKTFVLQNVRNNKQKKKQTKTITKIDMEREKAFEGETKNENEQIYYSLQS